jgi:hypothetical protein
MVIPLCVPLALVHAPPTVQKDAKRNALEVDVPKLFPIKLVVVNISSICKIILHSVGST